MGTEVLTWEFGAQSDFASCTRDASLTIDPTTGRVTLDKTILIATEQGNILHRRGEELSRFVWARKTLHLDSATCDEASLIFLAFQYLRNEQALVIKVNEHEIAYSDERTRGCYAWHVVGFPTEWLVNGSNSFIFRGGSYAFNSWILAVDNLSRGQGSAKSSDGGRNWQSTYMGYDGSVQGEYVVRLRLGQYAREGTITSPIIDLAGDQIGPSQGRHTVRFQFDGEIPCATEIRYYFRHGQERHVPSENSCQWEEIPDNEATYEAIGRFVQWQAKLHTNDVSATPTLGRVVLTTRPTGKAPDWALSVHLLQLDKPHVITSSISFGFQPLNEPKLAILREQELLDEVISNARREFDKFLLLRHWVARQWTWHGGITYSPWDALVILDWQRGTRLEEYVGAPVGFLSHGGCMHFSQVYIQCCLALGYQARGVAIDACPPPPDRSHFVAEVWSNELGKWILMDPTLDVHFEYKHEPLGGIEMQDLWLEGRGADVMQVDGPSTARCPLGPTWAIDEFRNGIYRFYSVVPRNDQLSQLSPSPIDHGQIVYHEDAYVWYGDMARHSQPWFSLYSTRRDDFLWSLNQVIVSMEFSATPGRLAVLLDTFTPDLSRFEIAFDGGEWREIRSGEAWALHNGENTMAVRAVNQLDVAGPTSNVRVFYDPRKQHVEQRREHDR